MSSASGMIAESRVGRGRRSYEPLRALRAVVVLVVVGYSVLHLGYSLFHYSIFSDRAVSGDTYRAFLETIEWKRTGTLPPSTVLYPPLYYLILLPLTNLEFQDVARVLYFTQFILYYFSVILMGKAASETGTSSAMDYLIVAVLTVNFQPFLETLAMHKVEGIELFLICLAIYTFRRKKDVLTGSLVCVAANLKYLPGILGVYFLLKREFKVVRGILGMLLFCLIILIPAFGISGLWTYVIQHPLMLLFGHHYEGTRPEASLEFQTLTGTINRLFVGSTGMVEHIRTSGYVHVPHAQLAFLIAAILKIGLTGFWIYLIRRSWRVSQRDTQWVFYLLEISLTLILIFVIAPSSRIHYAILLLPAFVITGLVLFHNPHVFQWEEKLLFALSYSLTAVIIPGGLLNRLPPSPLWGHKYSLVYYWMSLPFYGYLILGFCIILCYKRLCRSRGSQSFSGNLSCSPSQLMTPSLPPR